MAPSQRDEIRQFILAHVQDHPLDIARLASESFGVTRQAVHRHLDALIKADLIEATGKTRQKRYTLKVRKTTKVLVLAENREEDRVWRSWIAPALEGLPENILRICHYGFTEMYNNAVEHSEGSTAMVEIVRSPRSVKMTILDNGVGIFQKIKSAFHLDDHPHAILELSKGKLTTDPAHHTGEGIFFTSRMFDEFHMGSSGLLFVHRSTPDDHWLWLIDPPESVHSGTFVSMEMSSSSARTSLEVFNRYAAPDSEDYGFTKTHVPLSLARHGQDELISRSQAKRVLARFERFREVVLDFDGVETIGQAFADEIFRVFAVSHPAIEILAVNASEQVRRMIRRARSEAAAASHGPLDDPPEA